MNSYNKPDTNKASAKRILYVLFIALACTMARPAAAADQGQTSEIPSPPQVNARSAALIDATTGTLLYAKNPDISLPPASLAKLVTLHLVYEELNAGRLSRDELVQIDARDCSPYIPYGSSLMYLHPGMKVSIRDIMLGAAVVSGNDAAYTLARRISGSNDAFAVRMNEAVKKLGYDHLHFVEPSGLSEFNLVTAREFALFCRDYIRLHPESLKELHSVKSIDFPRAEHKAPGFVPEGRIIQYNRNPIIFSYDGADGLKTGYIIEVGYNMAATAKRGDSRFITVTLGGTGPSYSSGGSQRTKDTARLLDWAFDNFETASIDPGELSIPKVWFGQKRPLKLELASVNAVTIPRMEKSALQYRIELPESVDAPIGKGLKVGKLIYSLHGKDIRTIDIITSEEILQGNIFRRVWDGVVKFFAGIFG
ncbi:MAG: D-alanyl-D-alanine carboxypeptidase [Spirochaetaceae bacterium]|nr:D-alanyl-D-alanine carboxypeptidase [Spirochaetaceae bacterium]